jgi:hypothetical protein
MKALQFTLCSLVFLAFFASPSKAQIQRTFVSGVGNDLNPCSRLAPCRTFAQAVSQTAAGGEVVVLDSAGYGQLNIAQAISIVAPSGVYAGISVISDVGKGISAGASDTVVLRGITLNNQQISGAGIAFLSGTLHIENCVISGFSSGDGIVVVWPTSSGFLLMADDTLSGNFNAIQVNPSAGTTAASIDSVKLVGNLGNGLIVARANVSIRNSVASGNDTGLIASNNSGTCELNIDNCTRRPGS